MPLTKNQQTYIDISILNEKVKRCISSPEEYKFKKILNCIGKEGKDWLHQPAFYYEEKGLVAVPDFAFIKQKLIIELDGKIHNNKLKKKRDIERDKVFYHNEYEVIRIHTPIPKEKEMYWKVYIEETLKILEEKPKEDKKRKVQLFTKEEFEKEFLRKLEKTAE